MPTKNLVSGWMTEPVLTLSPDRPVVDAYTLMADQAIRHVPVVDGGRLVGIVSDRDLQRAAPTGVGWPASGVEVLFDIPISAVMTGEPLFTADPLDTIEAAASLMVAAKVSALPVLDGEKLVGIITTDDLLRALVELGREARIAAAH